jgi:5'-nucleotidase
MTTPRRTIVALGIPGVALALGLTVGLAPSAGSSAPQERKAGTSGAKAYDRLEKKKKNYVKLDLLAINDFHGNLEPPTGSSGQVGTTRAGGAAFLASKLNKERKKSRANGATPLTVAAGDLIGASPLLSAAFHDEPTIEAMNKMRLDVSSVGNHEFDEGVNELLRMQRGGCLNDGNGANGQDSCPGGQTFKGADWPYLGANVFWKNPAGHPRATPFRPFKIFKVGSKKAAQKVAFIGMTLEDTDTIVSQAGIVDVDFRDEVETANALVPKLRKKGVKSIIVLLHEGVSPADPSAYNDCSGVQGPALAIAQNLSPSIDAVVSGHTHQPYNCVVKDPKGKPRLLTSASSFGRIVTKLHFLIDPKTRDIVRPAAYAENMIVGNADGQKQSTKINKLISVFKTLVQPIANAVIGHLAGGATSISRAPDPDGSKDSVMGNVIADAQKADPTIVRNGQAPVIALMNPGGIRADLAAPGGVVTYGAAFSVQPFNNFMVSMDLTGAQILAILNEGFNGPTNEGPAAPGPTQNSNNKVLQVSGLTYTWDASDAAVVNAPAVSNVMLDTDADGVGDAPIDPAQTYRVAANNFLADGGDGFTTFKQGTNRLVGGLDIDSLRLYLEANDPYTVPTALTRIAVQP